VDTGPPSCACGGLLSFRRANTVGVTLTPGLLCHPAGGGRLRRECEEEKERGDGAEKGGTEWMEREKRMKMNDYRRKRETLYTPATWPISASAILPRHHS
jgi:hypothetical protein